MNKIKKNTIGINDLAFYIPDNIISVQSLEEYHSLSEKEKMLFDAGGVETIASAESENAVDLAIRAARLLCDNGRVYSKKIDVIIYLQGRFPKQLLSSEVTKLQEEIGGAHAFCFTLSGLGCVDISSALLLARQMLEANSSYENILIAYGNKPAGVCRFRYPVAVIGDAGMALMISRSKGNVILDLEVQSNGKYWDLFSMDYKNVPFTDWKEKCRDAHIYSFELAVESKKRFEEINEKILTKHNINMKDISHFIMQNISLGAYRFYEDLFDIKFDPVCSDNLKQYGHLGSIDILLNFQLLSASGRLKKNDLVLIMNNSPVAAWSSILLKQ